MAHHNQTTPRRDRFDPRDRAIEALQAQLKAEQETRETLIWAIRNGVTAPEVLEAIADDPVPAIDNDELPIRRFGATRRKAPAIPDKQNSSRIPKLSG